MSEHFLNGAEVGASLEQVRRERVAEEMGVDALRLQAGRSGQAAQDEEDPGPRERAALGVEEELRTVAAVEVRATAGEVAPDRLRRLAADRDDPLLRALADAADEPALEVDGGPLEARGLADAKAGAV